MSAGFTTPYRLERFYHSNVSCCFFRVPSWMGELRNLGYLRCQVGELPADGAGILAELPALTHLVIKIRDATKEMIVIYGGGAFPALKSFDLQLSRPSYLTFQAGAMPKLQRLLLVFNCSGSEQNGTGPAGMEHLLTLEEFSARIVCIGATESEKASSESALRSAINMHPSHPRVLIFFLTIPDAVFYRTNFFPSAQRQAAGNCVTSPLPTSGNSGVDGNFFYL
ncbi:uncharacterized protein LOC106866546 [Brachypodium distachyon]|uniref:uncharacterized protein LOC106866546 n=1 Tax=Brachypodium distachyon TaxID=15368 RepID=UPI00071E2A82|nr:uncharacterized protein LOC106866546 [Brachypodium distachyon]|eukprot:XP_014756676.1 uncharacterized protein LOC106866546 [Brachypodium distachyon]